MSAGTATCPTAWTRPSTDRGAPPNRRSVRTDTTLAGLPLASGDRLQVSWAAANRDPRAFDRPEAADPDRPDAGDTLTWGSGVHVCPGRPLAMLQLETVVTELATGVPRLRLDPDRPPVRARPPAGGFARVPVLV